MILGRGTAQTDEEIIAEYQQWVLTIAHSRTSQEVQKLLYSPGVCCKRINKPIRAWGEDDVLKAFRPPDKTIEARHLTFLTFLFFRGYLRPTLALLVALNICLSLHWRPWVTPYQERMKQSRKELGYGSAVSAYESTEGGVLSIFLWLLVVTGKTLDELTRADFDQFADAYQRWYQAARVRKGKPDPDLYRLECYLVHWNIFPPARKLLRSEQQLATLKSEPFQSALLTYFHWCDVKLSADSARGIRTLLLPFFLWLQEHDPALDRLDSISRQTALAYLGYLTEQRAKGCYGVRHQHALYNTVRRFFDVAIDEQFETAPSHNPFSRRDLYQRADPLPRYFSDAELQTILRYCEREASLFEQTLIITLLHTGIRAKEFVHLQATHIVQIGAMWKLHIHEGKGLKDRMIPLTPRCLAVLQTWQEQGWERTCDSLFTHFGRPWKSAYTVEQTLRQLGTRLGIVNLTAHRFRHSFAVALLNYGIRESALQKLMGHATLDMTLEYARILDQTVEQSFTQAVEHMQEGAHSWVPNFFVQEDYTLFVEGDAVSWIRLPLGYCRRNVKLHCESDVKCLLCDRFAIGREDLPRLQQMHERFLKLGLQMKADVVAAQIHRLELPSGSAPQGFIPMQAISTPKKQ